MELLAVTIAAVLGFAAMGWALGRALSSPMFAPCKFDRRYLAQLLRDAQKAHHVYEQSNAHKGADTDWSDWHARFMVRKVKSSADHHWNASSAFQSLMTQIKPLRDTLEKSEGSAQDLLSSLVIPAADCAMAHLCTYLRNVLKFQVFMSDKDWPASLQESNREPAISAVTCPSQKIIGLRDRDPNGVLFPSSAKLYLLLHESAHILLDHSSRMPKSYTVNDQLARMMFNGPVDFTQTTEAEAELTVYFLLSHLRADTKISLTYLASKLSWDDMGLYPQTFLERLQAARPLAEQKSAELFAIIKDCDHAPAL